MNFFNCPSCGSTSFLKIDNQYFCKYCKTIGTIEKQKKLTLYKIMLIIILLLSLAFYFLIKKSTITEEISQKEVFTSFSNLNSKPIPKSSPIPLNTTSEGNIENIYPSRFNLKERDIREKLFTSWQSKTEYQSKFNNKYYDKAYSYPAYVELDSYGNRRVIEIPYEPRFYWNVTSGKLLKYFQKRHIQQTMNGKKLLTMTSIEKNGVTLYSGTWISSEAFEREVRKLEKLGIYTPQLKFKKENIVNENHTLTKFFITTTTSNSEDADTQARIFLTVNHDENHKYLLDKAQYHDRMLGRKDSYELNIDYPLNKIQTLQLSIEGFDAWKMEQFTVQLKEQGKYSAKYIVNAKQWMSEEDYDQRRLRAKASLDFNLNVKIFSNKMVVVYLPI